MNVRISRVFAALGVGLAALASTGAAAFAAPVPVKLDMTNLRCIQTYAADNKADDEVYLVVTGVAKGAEVTRRAPETGAMATNDKTPAITDKAPLTLWEGELADGEFALVTVTMFNGKGDEPAKAFAGKLADAAKGVAERSKPTLAADDFKNLSAATLAAQQAVVTGVKETLGRDKNTDHFGGLFNVLVWNDNGALVKRLDPVGLTFGEHAGTDQKIYTKLKWTRRNVKIADESGEFFPTELPPISEDKQTVRVKMLENEYFKNEKGRRTKNTTDYLADLQLFADGKPVAWQLGNENKGQSQIHIWWDWAE
jgi:hypothetical protein